MGPPGCSRTCPTANPGRIGCWGVGCMCGSNRRGHASRLPTGAAGAPGRAPHLAQDNRWWGGCLGLLLFFGVFVFWLVRVGAPVGFGWAGRGLGAGCRLLCRGGRVSPCLCGLCRWRRCWCCFVACVCWCFVFVLLCLVARVSAPLVWPAPSKGCRGDFQYPFDLRESGLEGPPRCPFCGPDGWLGRWSSFGLPGRGWLGIRRGGSPHCLAASRWAVPYPTLLHLAWHAQSWRPFARHPWAMQRGGGGRYGVGVVPPRGIGGGSPTRSPPPALRLARPCVSCCCCCCCWPALHGVKLCPPPASVRANLEWSLPWGGGGGGGGRVPLPGVPGRIHAGYRLKQQGVA